MVGLLSPRCPEPRQEPARDVPAGKSLQVDPAGGLGPPLGELWLAQDPGVAQSSLSCPWNEGSSVIHDMPHPTPQGPWGHSCWPAPGQLTGEPLSSCLRRTLGVLGTGSGVGQRDLGRVAGCTSAPSPVLGDPSTCGDSPPWSVDGRGCAVHGLGPLCPSLLLRSSLWGPLASGSEDPVHELLDSGHPPGKSTKGKRRGLRKAGENRKDPSPEIAGDKEVPGPLNPSQRKPKRPLDMWGADEGCGFNDSCTARPSGEDRAHVECFNLGRQCRRGGVSV